MFDLSLYLEERGRWIDASLDHHLPATDLYPPVLHQAMRYSMFSGGKRLRPILCLAAAEACGATKEDALWPALALEAVHTYSLIHDDLPCMDDDDLRRGQPTAHIRFGEANALMAGTALLTLAFEWLGQAPTPSPHSTNHFIAELAHASGHQGIMAGQVADLAAEEMPASEELLHFIHLHKTATLIRAAVRMGGIAAGASSTDLDALSLYGCNLGLAFQIADDLLDETGKTEDIGKPAGSDRKNNKLTYVSLFGIEAARDKAKTLVEEATEALNALKGDSEPLRALAAYVIKRTH